MTLQFPKANILNMATNNLAIAAIAGYQRFVSPYKGFSCAHRVLHGSESCSQYFKRVIAEDGISVAIGNAKVRFQECRDANQILKIHRAKIYQNLLAIQSEEPDNQDTKKVKGSRWNPQNKQVNQQSPPQNNNSQCNCLDLVDCAFVLDSCDGVDCLSGLDCGNCSDFGSCN
jgi:putative component of membrane protein insertase Oxa1/YidC/SpoIIIJ protein YidD